MQRQQHSTEAQPTAIRATDIGLTYSDGTEAVTDVTLDISAGIVFGFLGPNGAGKTTTIKMLTTLLQPTSGRITVNGYDARTESRAVRESIGYMAQETSIDPSLTIRENLSFACRAYSVSKGDRAGRIDELLELIDLTEKADRRAHKLSGGQKKRLDAAMALVHHPPIVFLDEPTTGLDPTARHRLWDYFREINRQGTTIFLTTQYLEEADALCSDLAVIRDGQIVATGSPTDLKAQVGGDVLEIEFGDPTNTNVEHARSIIEGSEKVPVGGIETVQLTDKGLSVTSPQARRIGSSLLVSLAEADIEIIGFRIRSPTLEDVFFALTDKPERDTVDTEFIPDTQQSEVE